MNLGPEILQLLSKTYEPAAMVNIKFKGFDLAFRTDENGHPILLFLGKKYENGHIKGSRYARTLKKDSDGKVFKDHWEHKGHAS